MNLQPSSSSLQVEKKELVQLHFNTEPFNSDQERSSSLSDVVVPATLSPSQLSEDKNKNKNSKFKIPSQIVVRAFLVSLSLSLNFIG